jgi:hypothetical protein
MVGNLLSSFRYEENSSQHSTFIVYTTSPLQIEYCKDGCTYTFIINIGLRFNGMTWYKRVEIVSDGGGKEIRFKFVSSIGSKANLNMIHDSKSRILDAVGLQLSTTDVTFMHTIKL